MKRYVLIITKRRTGVKTYQLLLNSDIFTICLTVKPNRSIVADDNYIYQIIRMENIMSERKDTQKTQVPMTIQEMLAAGLITHADAMAMIAIQAGQQPIRKG